MEELEENLIPFSEPILDDREKLYVQAYLSKLSHSYAHGVVVPGIKNPKENNYFSRRENIKYHISKELHSKVEALSLTPEVIVERLFKEATSYGKDFSHPARIQALSILGKYLGMFKDKEESSVPTIHIINYSDSKIESKVEIDNKEPSLLEEILDEPLEDIILTDYSSSIKEE